MYRTRRLNEPYLRKDDYFLFFSCHLMSWTCRTYTVQCTVQYVYPKGRKCLLYPEAPHQQNIQHPPHAILNNWTKTYLKKKDENVYQFIKWASHLHTVQLWNGVSKFSPLSEQGLFSAFFTKPTEETGVSKHYHLSDQGFSAFSMKPTEGTGFPNILTCPTRVFSAFYIKPTEGTGFPNILTCPIRAFSENRVSKHSHLSDQGLSVGILHKADRGNRVSKNLSPVRSGPSRRSPRSWQSKQGFQTISPVRPAPFGISQQREQGFQKFITCPIRAFSAFSTKPASPFILTSLRIWKAVSPLRNGRTLNKKKLVKNLADYLPSI